ncbi:DUF2778 domain-containing protein [Martelella lutilitoris]|uniref:DUF2778 domain-containing protein n=1 Tax=Martelella lutilitoris TaxID=2583532 RepID=A0A5C4JWW7_9HYPH|nr:DUF2778 domain-containing protein [Martelella lutilitoris]TNB49805.1 DUF2778 domain-containing protein [Martelella lutilitoris]
MTRLATAAAFLLVTGGAIAVIAASPIISATVAKPQLSSTAGLGLTLNPAFRTPERAQSAKASRLLAAREGQARAKGLKAEDVRLSYLKPKLELSGQTALTVLQRKMVAEQIADNAGNELALAGVPPELMPKAPARAPGPATIAPSTALAAVSPSGPADDSAGGAFKLVLQGADDSRLAPGEVPTPEKRPAGLTLAYADFGHDGLDGIFGEVPERTSKVAVYDIAAGKVYMPDGEVMEAHSGKGKYRDDPNHTHVKMAGAVPAATYRLSMRESLFHGVPALRMTSVDGTNPLGRTGLLAHTYMLRTPGDSHGCLVFKDYYKFLKAYRDNEVDYIVAVPSLKKGLSTQLASRTS